MDSKNERGFSWWEVGRVAKDILLEPITLAKRMRQEHGSIVVSLPLTLPIMVGLSGFAYDGGLGAVIASGAGYWLAQGALTYSSRSHRIS